MKRKNEKVPEFDEIIFENRNKTYGAYDLRKHYNSVTNFSILGGVVLFAMLTLAITFTTENGTASAGPGTIVIAQLDDWKPEIIKQPDVKPPSELFRTPQNVTPEVVTDTTMLTSNIPTTDELITTVINGNVNDTLRFVENTDPVVPPETKPFIVVEEPVEYPGGELALLKYISFTR